MDTKEPLVSIATVSRETGIGAETLRVWERRYGRPKPVRLPSGHRRYLADQVEWLRRVADALARGWRPSRVLTCSEDELENLLGARGARAEPAGQRSEARAIRRVLDLARRFDERGLIRLLRRDSKRLDHAGFLVRRVLPLLDAVGRGWRDGELEVRHEHFVSEILEDLLRGLRRTVAVRSGASLIVMATLAGELHGLGLQAAALLLAGRGFRVHMLGTDTPDEEILGAVKETGARAVGISVSLATCSVDTGRRIAALRESLPAETLLLAGGQGARRVRRGVHGVTYMPELEDLIHWREDS